MEIHILTRHHPPSQWGNILNRDSSRCRWENEHVHGNRRLLSIRLSGLLQHDCVEAVYLAGVAQAIVGGGGSRRRTTSAGNCKRRWIACSRKVRLTVLGPRNAFENCWLLGFRATRKLTITGSNPGTTCSSRMMPLDIRPSIRASWKIASNYLASRIFLLYIYVFIWRMILSNGIHIQVGSRKFKIESMISYICFLILRIDSLV